MDFVFTLHSHTRWLVAIAAVVAIVKLAITAMQGKEYGKGDRIVTSAFVGMLDLQMAIGLVLLVWRLVAGMTISRFVWEHFATMLIAISIAHIMNTRAQTKTAPGTRARVMLLTFLGVAVLVYVGIMRLPQGGLQLFMP
ncbi:MAG: hypothetical protein IT211_10290 [Armatimonadetes bacterium]|nr:hypothetical protein [Armatimonadota bacterium]